MPTWDIDKCVEELEKLLPQTPGTTINRVLMPPNLLKEEGIKLTKEEAGKESLNVWCLGLGGYLAPKTFIHGRSLREVFLRARKLLKPHGMPKGAKKSFFVEWEEVIKKLPIRSPKKAKRR